jgi:hypothetical protein
VSIERALEDAAYFAAIVQYLIETKDDETDAEVVDYLDSHPWLFGVLCSTLEVFSKQK